MYRTTVHNRAVGGHPHSPHLLGIAADLIPDINTPRVRNAIVLDANRLGLWALAEEDHVHVQGVPPLPGKSPDSGAEDHQGG